MTRVRVHGHDGSPCRNGRGIYATEIMRANPLLPVEEERWLNDPMRREGFIERLYAYRRWRDLMEAGVVPAALLKFHAKYRLLLMAHGPRRAAELGRLAAQAGSRPIEALAAEYGMRFMSALRHRALRRWHAEALFHALGYLERRLNSRDRVELVNLIRAYRQGLVPRSAPITLLRHHFQRYPEPAMDSQLYWQSAGLRPTPREAG